MPFAFEGGIQKHQIPEKYDYERKMYTLSKIYHISIIEAGKMKETDYWKALAFNNIDVLNVQP